MRTVKLFALFAATLALGQACSAREVDDAAMVEARQAPLPRVHDERVSTIKSDAIVPAKYDASYPTRDSKRLRPRGSI